MSKGAKSNPTTPTTISPAIAYKMNKKIAQLTKVVYALNTKNEDHSTEVESIINAYEIEIQSVINQGNEKIQELAMELEVKNIEMSAHDQLGKDNHNLIALAESKNTDLKNENSGLNQRITSLQEELATRDSSIIELQEQIKELKTSIKNQSKAFKESVMAKSYSDGLASSEEVNVLKEQHRMELESQKKELDDGWQDTVSTLKKRHDEDAKYFQQESKRLKAAITENEHKHQEITKEIEQKYKAALANEEKKIADMNAQLVTVNQDIAKNSEALDIAKKSTIEKIIECNHLNKVYTEQSERLEEIEKDFFEKSSQMMRLEMQIDQLTSKLNRKTEQLSDLETAHENIKALYDNLNTDFTIVQSQKDTCLIQIKDQKIAYQLIYNERQSLTNETLELKHQLKKLNLSVLTIVEDNRILLETSLENLQLKLTTEHKTEMESTIGILKSKYDAEIHDLKIEVESLNIAWKTTLSNKEEMFKTMTEDYENMKNLLESKLTNSLQENTILTTQNTSLTRSLEEATHEVSNLQSLLQSAKINAEQMEQDRSHLYQKLVNLEGEIRHELDAKFKITLNASHDEWRAKLDRAVEDMRQEKHREHVDLTTILVSKMKLETSNEIDRITDDFIEKFGVLNADKLAAEQNLAVLNQSFNELMSKLSKLRDDHNEDIKKVKLNEQNLAATAKEAMEVNFNTQITQIKVQGAISLNNLEKKHAKNIEEIEQKHLLDLKEQADLNVKNIKEQETIWEIQHKILLEKIYSEQKYELEQLRLKQLQALDKQAMDIGNHWFEEMKKVEEKSLIEIEVKVTEILDLSDKLNNLTNTYEALVKENESNISTIKTQILDINSRDYDIDILKRLNKENLKQLDESWEARNEKECDEINFRNLEDAKKMLDEFEQGQNYLKKQISGLTRQLEEAAVKYINREPRQVDLDTIAQLQETANQLREKHDILKNEMQFYKLELNNREQNFNKIFNTNPKVGLIKTKTFKNTSDPMLSNPSSRGKLPPLFLA